MSNKILTYKDNAWLAVAAYAETDGEIITKYDQFHNKVGFSNKQLEQFNNRYTVKYQYAENITGFGATLFWDNKLKQHVLAIRGTEPTTFKDILNDAFLGVTGKAYEQEVALEAFYRRVTTSKADGGLGLLGVNEKINLAGHSLGGFLAQVFTSKHQNIVNHTYTYNAPGIDGIWGNIKKLFGLENDNYPNSKITNIVAKDGLSIISSLGINLGSLDIEFPGSSHSSVELANTISFYGLFATIDKDLSIDGITKFYENSNLDDVVNSSVKKISQIFKANLTSNEIQDKIVELTNLINNNYSNLTFNFLTNKSISQLNQSSKPNLYALINLNPFTIEGNLSAYDDIDVKEYSDMFIKKRAELLENDDFRKVA